MLSEETRIFRNKIGNNIYYQMKRKGYTLDENGYEQFKKDKMFDKEQRELKRTGKNKIRYKTIRYIERYCNLEMKCQICKTTEDIQIHHPNYNDYLKINLLCRKHHNQLHNFELVPPQIIDLEKIAIIKPPKEEKQTYIKENLEKMKEDVINNGLTCMDLQKKYGISDSTIMNYFKKEENYLAIVKELNKNIKRKQIFKKRDNATNPLLEYKIKNNKTTKELSILTGIPEPTLKAIESGKTNFNNIRFKTKNKLKIILEKEGVSA